MMIPQTKFLKAEGWTEVIRDDETELAVIRANSNGMLKLVAIVDEDDRDLGDYFPLMNGGIKPGPNNDPEVIAAKMMTGEISL